MLKDRPDETHLSWRCSTCGLNWPFEDQYRVCAQCETRQDRPSKVEPMDKDEAQSLVAHIKFELYYETTRGVASDTDTDPRFDPYRPGLMEVEGVLLLPEKT